MTEPPVLHTPIEQLLKGIERRDLVTNYRCGSSIEEMEQADEGEWCRFEEVIALLATSRSPALRPPDGRDLLEQLMKLARAGAVAAHIAALKHGNEVDGHKWRLLVESGFEFCPHPDCMFFRRDELEAALRRLGPEKPSEQVAWLVALGSETPQWWTGRGDEWTADVDGTKDNPTRCAMRFARKEDADRAIGWLVKSGTHDGCKAEEHLWL